MTQDEATQAVILLTADPTLYGEALGRAASEAWYRQIFKWEIREHVFQPGFFVVVRVMHGIGPACRVESLVTLERLRWALQQREKRRDPG